MKKSWKERKLIVLRFHYEKLAAAWDNEGDDRRLFCNLYKMIVHAVESLPDNPDNYVCCAMNNLIRDDRKTLDEIAARFAGR